MTKELIAALEKFIDAKIELAMAESISEANAGSYLVSCAEVALKEARERFIALAKTH